MPILNRLREVLDNTKIPYEIHNHPQAYTAQEIAATQHISGKKMAKVVILKADGFLVMVVVPADRMVSLRRVRTALGAKEISLASENEFASIFAGCEIGAMPPFGNLFGIPVYVDPSLEAEKEICFNAGNHEQTVKLRYADFKTIAHPIVISLVEDRKKRAA